MPPWNKPKSYKCCLGSRGVLLGIEVIDETELYRRFANRLYLPIRNKTSYRLSSRVLPSIAPELSPAQMAESVDARDLKSLGAIRAGSTPALGTINYLEPPAKSAAPRGSTSPMG